MEHTQLKSYRKSKATPSSLTWPCAMYQTLAHLSAFVKWGVKKSKRLTRCRKISSLIGEEKVYDLIDGIGCRRYLNYKLAKVNIGMDEAFTWLVWSLSNLERCGGSGISCANFGRVPDIARRYGFRCQMWGSMFFKLMSANGNYDRDVEIQKKPCLSWPSQDRHDLGYWDYYPG